MDKKTTDILYRYRYALLFLLCAASTLFSFIGTDRLRYGAVIFCGVMAAMAVMFFRRGGLNERRATVSRPRPRCAATARYLRFPMKQRPNLIIRQRHPDRFFE